MTLTDFIPDIRRVFLSPRNPTTFPICQTIGYFQGDIPSIVVHLGGDRFEVKLGQCIPTGGRVLQIENPYSRSANVQISINSAPKLLASADSAQQQTFVSYHSGYDKAASTVGDNIGWAMMPTAGRYVIEFTSQDPINVVTYRRADLSMLGAKPAGMMEDDVTLYHMHGVEIDNLTTIAGYWNSTLLADWLATIGLTFTGDRRTLAKYVNSGRFMMEKDTLLILRTTVPDKPFYASVTVRELPDLEGAAYV